MKILHVMRDLSSFTGGPVTAVLGMAQAQAVLGHQVTIAATDYGLAGLPMGNRVQTLVYPCRYATWRWSPKLARALPELIANVDLVHIHMVWEHTTWTAAKTCHKLGKPYILRPCGMLEKWPLSERSRKKNIYLHLLGNSVLRNAAALHFTSKEEMVNSVQLGNINCFVIPNGLPADFVQDKPLRVAFRRRYRKLEDKRIILFLGRLHYKKQPDVAIRAFSKISKIDSQFCLVLAGPAEPEYLAQLQRLIKELNLEEKILFTGLLTGDVGREAFSAADIFVLPSLQENFGIAVAEAMAAECPVIVSEQVNLAKEIREAKAGIVCQSDVDSFATAMECLIKDKALRVKMGKNGRNLVMNQFMWPKVSEKLIDVYQDILSSTRKSNAWRINVT